MRNAQRTQRIHSITLLQDEVEVGELGDVGEGGQARGGGDEGVDFGGGKGVDAGALEEVEDEEDDGGLGRVVAGDVDCGGGAFDVVCDALAPLHSLPGLTLKVTCKG
jgi:hypothetical protein